MPGKLLHEEKYKNNSRVAKCPLKARKSHFNPTILLSFGKSVEHETMSDTPVISLPALGQSSHITGCVTVSSIVI